MVVTAKWLDFSTGGEYYRIAITRPTLAVSRLRNLFWRTRMQCANFSVPIIIVRGNTAGRYYGFAAFFSRSGHERAAWSSGQLRRSLRNDRARCVRSGGEGRTSRHGTDHEPTLRSTATGRRTALIRRILLVKYGSPAPRFTKVFALELVCQPLHVVTCFFGARARRYIRSTNASTNPPTNVGPMQAPGQRHFASSGS